MNRLRKKLNQLLGKVMSNIYLKEKLRNVEILRKTDVLKTSIFQD